MKKNLYVKQDDHMDCGVSCLLSIIRYYNGDAAKEYLRDMTETSKDGVNAFNLLKAGKSIGFDCYGINASINDICDHVPVIAHVVLEKSYQHFVVIYKVNMKKNTITIMDPSYGIKNVSFESWHNMTTNNYLLFKPIKVIPKLVNNNKFMNIIWPFISNNKKTFVEITLMSIIYTILSITTSYSFKLMLDEVNINSINSIKSIFLILIFLYLIQNLIKFFRNNLVNYVNHLLDRTLISDIYNHIINLPYLYYKNRTTGDVITRINDLNNVRELVSKFFVSIIIDSLLMICVCIILFNINITLWIVSILMFIGYIVITLIFDNGIFNRIRDSYNNSSIVNSYLIESISSIDTIKGLCLQKSVLNKFKSKYYNLNNINYKLMKTIHREDFFNGLLSSIGNLLIIYLGICEIKNGNFTVTSLIVYINLLNYFISPISELSNLNLMYKNAKESLRRVLELYKIKNEDLSNNYKCLDNLSGNIEFKNLNYSYNGLDNIIKNFNCKIISGNKVLIHGVSGSGKSTIMKILNRYLEGYKGKVLINDNDINVYGLKEIRNKICYVSQKENLFTDSIYNNVVLNRDISYDMFLKIAKITHVDEFANNYCNKYDYLLEENGFNLSGGEKQRIVLARSLLKNSDIYIFDEALSAVSIAMERNILKEVFELLKDKTIIVVSHRFNNKDLFDQNILVGEKCV